MPSEAQQGEAGFKLPLRLDETTGQVVDANDMLVYETAGRFVELKDNPDDEKWEWMPGERESTERLLRMVNSQPSLLAACKAVEWCGTERDEDDEDGEYCHSCPWCGEPQESGHVSDCKLAAAIALAEGRAVDYPVAVSMNANEMTLEQCIAWLEVEIQQQQLDALGPKARTEDYYRDPEKIPPTLDAIAGAMPEGWGWRRMCLAPVWEAAQEGMRWTDGVHVKDTGDEKLDRARLAVACRMAMKK